MIKKNYVYMDADGNFNAQAGDILEANNYQAKVHQVHPKYGLTMDTLGPGMKLRVTWSISELSMMGAHVIETSTPSGTEVK